MRVINKKVIISILMFIEVCSLFLMYKSFNNKDTVLDDVLVKENNEVKKKTFAVMINDGSGNYTESSSNTWPSNMIYNEELSGCIDIRGNKIDGALSFENNMATLNTNTTAYCYLYFDKNNNVYNKLVDDYTNSNGVSLLSDTSSDTYPVYYYTGNVTNNNIIYADKCWKMVRTTDTGGVKLIYNGDAYHYSQYNNIEENEYNVSTNTPSGTPFTFDGSTKKWTSGIAGVNSTTNTIEFTVTTAGNYVLAYDVSSQTNSDRACFYKNETLLISCVSGTKSAKIDLEGLTTSDVIKVKYIKDSSGASGSDTVSFSIGTAVGEKIKGCNNTEYATDIGSSTFNSFPSFISPAHFGYMYNTIYKSSSKSSLSSNTTSYVYGNSVTWNGSNYTLNTTISGTWSSLYNGGLDNYHYTCFSTSTTCTSVYYIYYGYSNVASYIILTGGVNIGEALNEMLWAEDVNTTNSTIKTKIDSWYESNIKEKTDSNGKLYSSYLENTIYCNNRATTSLGGFNPDGGSITSSYEIKFNYNSLTCENKTDQFTLKESAGGTAGHGNNALDYPIGLLTYKEASLARNGSSANYLNNNSNYWLMSPFQFEYINGYIRIQFVSNGNLYNQYMFNAYGVRPVVSLSSMVKIKDGVGDGSVTSPYELSVN